MKPVFKRSATFLAVAGLTLSLGAVGAPATFAQDPTPSPQVPTVIDFDTEKTGSITVNKRSGQPGANHDTGREQTITNAPLSGATFKLYKIMDIDNAADFLEASKKTVADAGEGTLVVEDPAVPTGEKTTGESGSVKWDNLDVGLYKVVETKAPEGFETTAPYLVYLPMTDPAGTDGALTTWNYDVVTYPKDAPKEEATKEVVDADQNVGDNITYKITSPIPAVTAKDVEPASTVRLYRVEDQLDAENVEVLNDTDVVAVIGKEVTTVDADGIETKAFEASTDPAFALVAGTDYTVVRASEGVAGKVVVTFTTAGLAKLTAAKQSDPDLKVQTSIVAKVKAVGTTDGTAVNTADIFYSNPNVINDVVEEKIPTNEVKTYWAKLKVQKQGLNTEGNPVILPGAEFQLYRCNSESNNEAAGDMPTAPAEAATAAPSTLGDAISIDHDNDTATAPMDTWITGDDGTLTIDGLHVTDFENNAGLTVDKQYCLVETKAPAGYELLPEPVPFTLTTKSETVGEEVITTVDIEQNLLVENLESNQIKLPLTGGMGIGIFAALGALIIGAGAFAARRNNA